MECQPLLRPHTKPELIVEIWDEQDDGISMEEQQQQNARKQSNEQEHLHSNMKRKQEQRQQQHGWHGSYSFQLNNIRKKSKETSDTWIQTSIQQKKAHEKVRERLTYVFDCVVSVKRFVKWNRSAYVNTIWMNLFIGETRSQTLASEIKSCRSLCRTRAAVFRRIYYCIAIVKINLKEFSKAVVPSVITYEH